VRAARTLAIAGALLGGSAAAHAQNVVPCSYAAPADIVTIEDCGSIDVDGTPHVRPEQLARLSYDANGLATIHFGEWLLIRRDGGLAPVMAFDNWAEEFSSGLARSPRGGKIGFINPRLELVIPAKYDGAYRFEGGRAAVCVGCHMVPNGEHGGYASGSWFCITPDGRETVSRTPGNCPPVRKRR
jgi:hypothetical protein